MRRTIETRLNSLFALLAIIFDNIVLLDTIKVDVSIVYAKFTIFMRIRYIRMVRHIPMKTGLGVFTDCKKGARYRKLFRSKVVDH